MIGFLLSPDTILERRKDGNECALNTCKKRTPEVGRNPVVFGSGFEVRDGERVLIGTRRKAFVEHHRSCWYLLSKPGHGAYNMDLLRRRQ